MPSNVPHIFSVFVFCYSSTFLKSHSGRCDYNGHGGRPLAGQSTETELREKYLQRPANIQFSRSNFSDPLELSDKNSYDFWPELLVANFSSNCKKSKVPNLARCLVLATPIDNYMF